MIPILKFHCLKMREGESFKLIHVKSIFNFLDRFFRKNDYEIVCELISHFSI